MAKYVVNSRLFFARNFILAEKSRLRSSPLLQAAKRCKPFSQAAKLYGLVIKIFGHFKRYINHHHQTRQQ